MDTDQKKLRRAYAIVVLGSLLLIGLLTLIPGPGVERRRICGAIVAVFISVSMAIAWWRIPPDIRINKRDQGDSDDE